MGAGASKKKKAQDKVAAVKKPVWVDGLGLEDGTIYTGLTAMGLVRLKPHLVGQLIYAADDGDIDSHADDLNDAVSEIGLFHCLYYEHFDY